MKLLTFPLPKGGICGSQLAAELGLGPRAVGLVGDTVTVECDLNEKDVAAVVAAHVPEPVK